MSELVKWKDWRIQYWLSLRHWDEDLQKRMRAMKADLIERQARVTRGEITSAEAFPRDDLEALLQREYDKHPEWPRRYRLPKRWQWCGPWNSES